MKKFLAILLAGVMAVGMLTACGGNNNTEATANLEGTCLEILDQIYATAELDPDFVEALQYYEKTTIPADDAEMKAWMIGTADVNFTDSAYSAPMMSSVAYQCILLRLEEGADVEAAKQTILDNADPIKWVCVEAEKVVVTNVGDVILFVMTNEATATALETAFLALAK